MREIKDTRYSRVDISEVNYNARHDPSGYISKSEEYYNTQVEAAAEKIINSDTYYKFVLLCGPSASGKTTTAHKLAHRLDVLGIDTRVISMDDFFIGMRNYPLLEDGSPNMESIEAMDLDLLNESFETLLKEGKAMFPKFDFETQTQHLEAEEVILKENSIIIMEGIHSLNPEVLHRIPKENVFRMYVSVRTKFMDGEDEVLAPGEIRLLRRLVRDYKFRNYSPLQTLEYWHHVRASERINIDPYRDDVDLKMDNTIDYEVCIWRELLKELLDYRQKVKVNDHPELSRIYESLERFERMSFRGIPNSSLLREFIGESV